MKSYILFGVVFATFWSAIPVQAKLEICKGNRVYSKEYGMAGVVKEVFTNGTAEISFDGDRFNHKFLKTSALQMSVQCWDQICKGDRGHIPRGVHGEPEERGVVEEVFSGGAVNFSSNGFDHVFVEARNIGKSMESVNGIRKGDRVYYAKFNDAGTVIEVFSDGVALVDFDTSSLVNIYKSIGFVPIAEIGGHDTPCVEIKKGDCSNPAGQINALVEPANNLPQSKITDQSDSTKTQAAPSGSETKNVAGHTAATAAAR